MWRICCLIIICLIPTTIFAENLDILNIKLFVEDKIDILELNHFYDDNGGLVLDQYLFWQNENIREWRLVKDARLLLTGDEYGAAVEADRLRLLKELNLKEFPKDFNVRYVPKWIGSSYYRVNHRDKYVDFNDVHVDRRIHFDTYYESWTQFDPELLARDILNKEERVGFRDR